MIRALMIAALLTTACCKKKAGYRSDTVWKGIPSQRTCAWSDHVGTCVAEGVVYTCVADNQMIECAPTVPKVSQ